MDIKDETREHRVGWLGHAMRPGEEDLVRANLRLTVEGWRGRGRPKLTWDQMVMTDVRVRDRRDLGRRQKGLEGCCSSTRPCRRRQDKGFELC